MNIPITHIGADIVLEDNQIFNSQKICMHESHPFNHNILALYSNAIDHGHSLSTKTLSRGVWYFRYHWSLDFRTDENGAKISRVKILNSKFYVERTILLITNLGAFVNISPIFQKGSQGGFNSHNPFGPVSRKLERPLCK